MKHSVLHRFDTDERGACLFLFPDFPELQGTIISDNDSLRHSILRVQPTRNGRSEQFKHKVERHSILSAQTHSRHSHGM